MTTVIKLVSVATKDTRYGRYCRNKCHWHNCNRVYRNQKLQKFIMAMCLWYNCTLAERQGMVGRSLKSQTLHHLK